MSTYLVTGGAGFIGSNIVMELLRQGQKVRILDNFSTGKRENITKFLSDIELIEGDLRDFGMVKKAVDGVEFVFHQGALPSVPRSVEDPISSNQVNVDGTLNVLVAAKESGVKRVVYASSSSVYGDNPVSPKVEDMSPNPLSPYAVTKLVGEEYCNVFSKIYGLEAVSLRYFNVFGPNQDPDSAYAAVIPKFIRAMINEESPTIFGDGLQSRDFSYIANVVKANLLAMKAWDVSGEVFNIACQKRHTLLDLVELLNNILNTNIKPVHTDARPGDIKHSLADIDKAKNKLGYETEVEFKKGLEKTVLWFKEGAGRKDLS